MHLDFIAPVQRRRAKGFRLPEGSVCVDRSTPWGNPFVIGVDGTAEECVRKYYFLLVGGLITLSGKASYQSQKDAFEYARLHLAELRAKILACWCRLDRPCHRNVLFVLANDIPALPLPTHNLEMIWPRRI